MVESKFKVTARKFRPQTFSQIVGQPHIVRTLSNALDNGRAGHAYIFSGARGVGKTTTARILAKAFNCKKGVSSEPCLECSNCVEIAQGSSMDVMEIDGASNTGVDNIRELKENVMFSPTSSAYKIYIIDEVHQISKAAFNALLKTLEEPPAHVKFIFATTELNKVPDTILSRCQSFEYKSISLNDIIAQLNMIAEHEAIKVSPSAVEIIARRAGGSMRDAQSMFDQAAAYGAGEINEDDVKLILGLVDRSTLFGVVQAIMDQDKGGLLELTESVTYSGSDPGLFLEDLVNVIRHIMIARFRPEGLAGFESDEQEQLKVWAGAFDYDEIQRFFAVITETIEKIKYSTQPMINLEMGLLRLTEKRGLVSIDKMIDKIDQAQSELEQSLPEETPAVHTSSVPEEQPSLLEVDTNIESAPNEIQSAVSGEDQDDLLQKFKNSRPMMMGIFEHATVQIKNDVVVIVVGDLMAREQLENDGNKALLEKVAQDHLGKKVRIVTEFHDEKKKLSDEQAGISAEKEKNIKKQVMDSDIIQSALDIFHGEVVDFKVSKNL